MDTRTHSHERLRSHGQFACNAACTPLGVRHLRTAVAAQLAHWGWPSDSDTGQALALVVAELGANAATHGGREGALITLRLAVLPDLASPVALRVEVTDARGDVVPRAGYRPSADAVCGRGLVLVGAVTARWGWFRQGADAKTVWAEVPVR
jgi:hypothetical protein